LLVINVEGDVKAIGEANRGKDWDEGGDEERSDEWKVVRYGRRRCNAFAVASLQPSLQPSILAPPHLLVDTQAVWVKSARAEITAQKSASKLAHHTEVRVPVLLQIQFYGIIVLLILGHTKMFLFVCRVVNIHEIFAPNAEKLR